MENQDWMENDSFATDKAREILYNFFSLATSRPKSKRWERLFDQNFQSAVIFSAEFFQEKIPLGKGSELLNLKQIAFPGLDLRQVFLETYDEIFGFVPSKDCLPYETEYCVQATDVFRSQTMGDIGGFYKAFGLEPSRDEPERPDHISLELEFMAWLIEKEWFAKLEKNLDYDEKAEICRDAQRKFFENHLAWWVSSFCQSFQKKSNDLSLAQSPEETSTGFYQVISRSISAFFKEEGSVFNITLPCETISPNFDPGKEVEKCGFCPKGV